MAALFTGTSGYSYGEWVDAGVYPKGTHAANMLTAYTRHFNAVELNYTWYQMPKAPSLERMAAQVPGNFMFSLKLTRTLTHEVDKTLWKDEAAAFRRAVAPLVDTQKLLSILVQLPPYFRRTPDRRAYLAALLEEFTGLPMAVEFRHPSWVNDKVFYEFERRNITLVTVDGPPLPHLFPRLDLVTNPDLIYLRLHGRNSAGWRSGNMQKQFDYDYSETELRETAALMTQRLMPGARAGALFFNNHVRGQAPKNCLRLAAILQAH
ncbi:MAG: DUF72 domain-containing protein [Desulfobacter sp.]|nr:MAG: DUF72 domain-containing protein [Desulfobacter sp.]